MLDKPCVKGFIYFKRKGYKARTIKASQDKIVLLRKALTPAWEDYDAVSMQLILLISPVCIWTLINSCPGNMVSPSHTAYLDGQRVQVDLLQGLDLHVLNQAAQLGDRHPLTKQNISVKNWSRLWTKCNKVLISTPKLTSLSSDLPPRAPRPLPRPLPRPRPRPRPPAPKPPRKPPLPPASSAICYETKQTYITSP